MQSAEEWAKKFWSLDSDPDDAEQEWASLIHQIQIEVMQEAAKIAGDFEPMGMVYVEGHDEPCRCNVFIAQKIHKSTGLGD